MNTRSNSSAHPALALGALLLAATFSGCTATSRFSVDAHRLEPAAPSAASYRLTAGRAISAARFGHEATTALMRDAATALSSRGFFAAPSGERDELEIEVDLVQAAPVTRTLTHTVPVYAESTPRPPSGGVRVGESASAPATPRKVGERLVTQTVVTHPRQLHLTAWTVDALGVRRGSAVWSVRIESDEVVRDLAEHARMMLAAGMDWIATSTDVPREVVLTARDRRVLFLARGMGPARPAVAAIKSADVRAAGG